MPSALFVTTVDITLRAFLLPFAEHLRGLGWRVDALAAGAADDSALDGEFDARFNADWSRSPVSFFNLAAAKRVREVVDQGDYDVVWVHTPIAAMITRFALRNRVNRRPAVVYTAHGFHFLKGGSAVTNLVYRTMERTAARWTDVLVTINHEDHAAARGFNTIPESRVRLIRGIGVDASRLTPDTVPAEQVASVRSELAIPDDALVLTMIAEFNRNKRHMLALDALALTDDPRIVLVFVGSGGTEDAVRGEAGRRGLSDRVRFAGYRRDIDAVLAASDALLLCSAREGLNRSALEAMASGVPVIGTPTRGIADAIGDPEGGWTAVSHKPAALAAAIDDAFRDPAERLRRGVTARQRVVREYSLDHVIAEYDRVFAEVIGAETETRS